MNHYDFALKFALRHDDDDPEACVNRLYEAGCDDAIVGIGKRGRISLSFTREANSAHDAVITALDDVKRAIPDARFIEATPDFVGVTDIAEILGFSRQNMEKLLRTSGQEFPPPVHDGKRPVWHLEPVLKWFTENQKREIDIVLLEISSINMRCNIAKQESKLTDAIPDQLRAMVA